MSSIRPLITITILVAVGAFLFMKINEGPVALPPEMDESLGQAPAAEIPPLATASDTAAPGLERSGEERGRDSVGAAGEFGIGSSRECFRKVERGDVPGRLAADSRVAADCSCRTGRRACDLSSRYCADPVAGEHSGRAVSR